MSRPRGGSGLCPLPAPQRDASPPPALPHCISQASHTTPLRVFGSEITNRIPTPPPQMPSSLAAAAPLGAATATLCGVAVDAPPSHATLMPTSSSSWLAADPCRRLGSSGDDVECIPTYETLLGAIRGARMPQEPPPLEGVRSCSRSSNSSDAGHSNLFPPWTGGGGGRQSLLEPTRGGAGFQTEALTPPAPSAKRRFRDGETEDGGSPAGPGSSWPQAKRQRGEEATVGSLAGALLAPPMQEGGMRDPGGADSIRGGGDVDVRPTLHTFSSGDDGDPWSARGGVCGFLTPLSTKLLCLPPVAFTPLPPSQHLHARACRPASLLDREHAVPAWQVLASAPTTAEEEQREGLGRVASTSSNTTLYTPARGNVHLRSAVDDAIVYSPLTLDDVSPILCLSEERLAHRRMRMVECDRRPSAEVDDEEHWANEAFAATLPSTSPHPSRALTPAESRGDEEDMSGIALDLPSQYPAGSARFLHEEALRLLTVTCEDEHGHLLQ